MGNGKFHGPKILFRVGVRNYIFQKGHFSYILFLLQFRGRTSRLAHQVICKDQSRLKFSKLTSAHSKSITSLRLDNGFNNRFKRGVRCFDGFICPSFQKYIYRSNTLYEQKLKIWNSKQAQKTYLSIKANAIMLPQYYGSGWRTP